MRPPFAVGFTAGKRFRYMRSLGRLHHRRKGRLVWVDDRLDDHRSVNREGGLELFSIELRSSIRTPRPPHASANFTKSMGVISTPYSGLPRKTICSHLIIPSTLFLSTTTLTGSRYRTQVAN